VGGEVEFTGGAVELPDGDGGEDENDGPEGDHDGGGPFGVEAGPEAEDGVAVVDAEPDGDDVAQETTGGEGPHELFALHVDGSSGEDEGPERHGWGKDGGEGDGEDGVLFHPGCNAVEGALGDVLLEEGHATGGSGGVGGEASDGGSEGGDGDEEDGVGVGGGVDDDEDVGDAGNGERNEGAVDDRDKEEADEAEVEEEVHEAVVGSVLGPSDGQAEGEEGCEREAAETHAVVMTVARMRETRGNFLGSVAMFDARWPDETWGSGAGMLRGNGLVGF